MPPTPEIGANIILFEYLRCEVRVDLGEKQSGLERMRGLFWAKMRFDLGKHRDFS